MATITATSPNATTLQRTLTETTLTGTADTFTYNRGNGDWLQLRNPTGGGIAPTIVGASAGLVSGGNVKPTDASTGFAIASIAAGATKVIFLDDIGGYLAGAITITGGTGLVASLLLAH